MKIFLLIMVCYALVACGSESERSTPPILDAQLDAIDKAKSVEQALKDAAKAREESMREEGT